MLWDKNVLQPVGIIHETYLWVSLLLKFTGDTAFLKVNSTASPFEELWSQFERGDICDMAQKMMNETRWIERLYQYLKWSVQKEKK